MTKYEALRTGQFERLEFTGCVATTGPGWRRKRWRAAFITYRPQPYEHALTEDILVEGNVEVGRDTTLLD